MVHLEESNEESIHGRRVSKRLTPKGLPKGLSKLDTVLFENDWTSRYPIDKDENSKQIFRLKFSLIKSFLINQ